jgi:hypothetical protein
MRRLVQSAPKAKAQTAPASRIKNAVIEAMDDVALEV